MNITAVFEPTVQHPYGYVYVTHDLVNHKYYCGKHKSAEFDTDYYGSGTLLKKSLQQHPLSNFICVPIDWAETAEELHQKEVQWIQHYNAVDDPMWYNLIEDSNKYGQNQCFNSTNTEFENEWSKLSNSGIHKLIQIGVLNKVTTVFFFMVQHMLYKNLVYLTQAEIAKQLKINKSNVHVIIKQLIQLKVCLPLPKPTNPTKTYNKGYIINPEIIYKGKPEQLKECYGIWNNAEQKHNDKSSTSDKSSDKINSLKSLIITKFLNTENCIIRSKYTAVYPDKLREFIAKHGYSDSDLKLLADSGFFLKDKNQITKLVKIDGKSIRMYCISISSEVQKPKTGSEFSEPVTQVFTSVTHSEEIHQLDKLLQQSQKYGGANTNNINPKLFILSYLKECATGNGVVNTTIQEIVDTTGVSKSTIIPFLRWLQQHKFILRPKSGVIVLTKSLQKYNLPSP